MKSGMIFTDKEKEELIKTEVELIELGYKISDKLGQTAIETTMHNFRVFLERAKGEKIFASFDAEYREFIIKLLKAIPEELIHKALPVILGVRK